MLGMLTAGVAALVLSMGAALAQESRPLYGEVALEGGFFPDPWSLDLVAGGDRWAGDLDPACDGYVAADAPDVTLQFSRPITALNVFLSASEPVGLAVRLPNGAWRCSGALEPIARLVIGKPVPGTYEIWTAAEDGFPEARLFFSERLLADADLAFAGTASAFDPDMLDEPRARIRIDAAAPGAALAELSVVAGGPDSADMLSRDCVGSLDASAADLAIMLAEPTERLGLSVLSAADTALAVRTADGAWHCDDDSFGHNPAVTLADPAPGEILVWVSTWGGGTTEATLHVRAGDPQWPADASLRDVEHARHGALAFDPGAESPQTLSFPAGGPVHAGMVAPTCSGHIDAEGADLFVDLPDGLDAISLYATSSGDLTLIVVTPEGTVLCDDDSWGMHPAVTLTAPAAGRYSVWVGNWVANDPIEATLYATVGAPQWDAAQPRLDVEGMTALEAFRAALAFHDAERNIVYGSAADLPGGGFELRDVLIGPEEGGEERLPVRLLRVNRIDTRAFGEPGRLPETMNVELEGLDLTGLVADDEMADVLFGAEPAIINLAIDYDYDPVALRGGIERLTIVVPGQGEVGFTFVMLGSPPDPGDVLLGMLDPSSIELRLESAVLDLKDTGLLRRALEAGAAEEQTSVEALVEIALAELTNVLVELGIAGEPATDALVEAVSAFARENRRPRHLSLSIAPAEPLDFRGVVMGMLEPAVLLNRLGLKAVYTAE